MNTPSQNTMYLQFEGSTIRFYIFNTDDVPKQIELIDVVDRYDLYNKWWLLRISFDAYTKQLKTQINGEDVDTGHNPCADCIPKVSNIVDKTQLGGDKFTGFIYKIYLAPWPDGDTVPVDENYPIVRAIICTLSQYWDGSNC